MGSLKKPLGLLFASLFLTTTAAASHGPTCVNDNGDPQRLVVEGCKTFTPEQIIAAATSNVDVVLAAHPAAPLEKYRATLRDRIVAGYQHAGFPYVEVAAQIDRKDEKMRVTIKEGPRYTAGEIVVRGNKDVAADELIKVLTSRRPPDGARLTRVDSPEKKPVFKWIDKDGNNAKMDDPVWEPDKPASFDWVSHQIVERWTKRALADQGFFSTFETDLIPQSDGKTALLVIRIIDEGPKAVLGEITVTGNQNNTRNEILDYFGLKTGMAFVPNWQAELEHRLWRSGRFIKSQATIDPPAEGDHRAPLRIELTESPWAPRLSEPLSPEQTVLLKLRDQLANPNAWPGDLIVAAKAKDYDVEFIFSATHGAVTRMRWSAPPQNGYPARFDGTFLISDRQCGLVCAEPTHVRLLIMRTGTPRSKLWATISLNLLERTDDPESTRSFMFHFGAKSLDEGESAQPFTLVFDVTPSFFLAIPTIDKNVTSSISDDVLTVFSSKVHLRVEASTGRLMEYVLFGEDDKNSSFKIRFGKNTFESRLAEIQKAAAHSPNLYDADAPLTSWIALVGSDEFLGSLKNVQPETLRWLRLAWVMQQKGVFEGPGGVSEILGPLFSEKDKEREFRIPATPDGWNQSNAGMIQYVVMAGGLSAVDKIFPRNTWPWTFTRELVFVATRQSRYSWTELQGLWTSNQTGPLFYLAAAEAFNIFNPDAAKMFAIQGLQKLSADDFKKDCRALLDKDCIAGRCARRMAVAVRELKPEEVEAILGPLPTGETSALAELVRVLRARPEQPVDEALFDALTAAWEAGQRDRVKARLASIRDRITAEPQPLVR
ncbi:MAG TPA: hypothetical protein VJL29_03860 [Thermoguttaceae bacterium]|nr:hypothetical protein [Thermoguttaceae bacterium]